MAIFNGINVPIVDEQMEDGSEDSEFEIEMTDDSAVDSDAVIEDMIEQQVKQLTMTAVSEIKDSLRDMSQEVAESKQQLEESEILMKEVMQDLEQSQKRRPVELPSLDIPADPVETVDISDDSDSSIPPPVNGDKTVPLTEARRPEPEQPRLASLAEDTSPDTPPSGVISEGVPPPPLDVTYPTTAGADIRPVVGPLLQELPGRGDKIYGMTLGLLDAWEPGVISEVVTKPTGELGFKVKFDEGGVKNLTPKQVAKWKESAVRIPVGSRVLAVYLEDDQDPKDADFFAAVVGERPKESNKGRYLVFYDDGYASYLSHDQIRLVYKADSDVWKDLHDNSKVFVQNYVQKFPSRRMIKLAEGDKVITELQGKWVEAEVNEVDSSLVQMTFPDEQGCEWIYRGSTRLQPIAKALGITHVNTVKRWRKPILKGVIRQVQLNGSPGPRPAYVPHVCGQTCSTYSPQYNPLEYQTTNPLLIPILHGWRREVGSQEADDSNWSILYIAPCGRRLRDLDEVHAYLSISGSALEIDYFAFDCWIQVMDQFIPQPEFLGLADISHGQEKMPLSASNCYDSSYPPLIEYSIVPIPQHEVEINSDPEFLVGCDCTDDCINKGKCACWQLTITSTKCDIGGKMNIDAGYVNRRLQDVVLTGIYECNKTCKCASTCINRLAQFPIRSRLQIFKTENRGWGIRTLDDLPQGAFICTYVGKLYGPKEGNKQGMAFGDDYFADLDMIEVVEDRKEGYESDVTDIEEDGEDVGVTKATDEIKDDASEITFKTSNEESKEGESKDGESKEGESTDEVSKDEVSKNEASIDEVSKNEVSKDGVSEDGISKDDVETSKSERKLREPKKEGDNEEMVKHKSVRKYFGPDEDIYIMDAMTQGNIGRYLNHSCEPNVFVQNVFVNTHDLRFPSIAFFALSFVRAGSELCWNYNYEVGTVENKQIICNCGARNCKGRLL